MVPTIETCFADVAASVFDEYFWRLGARRVVSSDKTVVRYSADKWFAEVLYLPLDGPKYSPRIEIGCRPEQYVDPRRNRVDVMHTAPKDSEEYYYNLRWRYQSSGELRTVLEAVKDKILEVYAIPFLQDTNRLKNLLKQRNEIVESEWKQQINDHNDSVWRTKAEAAFKAQDYAEVIQCYSNIPTDRHTKVDEAKLRFSRKQTV